MKRTYKKKSNLINKTGYTPGYDTEKNPVNYIPSEDITMANTPYPLYATPLDEDGNPIGKGMIMQPGGEYKFPNAAYVAETPMFAKGGEKSNWISAKISTLVREGYPQKQAVAIAYSMYEDMKKENGGFQLPMYQFGNTFPGSNFPKPKFSADPNIATPEQFSEQMNKITEVNPGKYGLGKDPNYVSPLSEESLTAGEDFKKRTDEMGKAAGLPQDFSKNIFGETTTQNTEDKSKVAPPDIKGGEPFQFFNPYSGFDIPTAASTLGSSIESGDTLGTVASGLKLATGLARNFFGGMGQERRKNYLQKEYYDKQREGMTGQGRERMARFGGYYQDGGEEEAAKAYEARAALQLNQYEKDLQNHYDNSQGTLLNLPPRSQEIPTLQTPPLRVARRFQRIVEPETEEQKAAKAYEARAALQLNQYEKDLQNHYDNSQGTLLNLPPRSQEIPTLQTPPLRLTPRYQEGGMQPGMEEEQVAGQEQQMMQEVAQALQQGMSPEEVMQQLVQMGMPEDQAVALIQGIMQQMQPSTPQLRRGGMMYYQEGGEEGEEDEEGYEDEEEPNYLINKPSLMGKQQNFSETEKEEVEQEVEQEDEEEETPKYDKNSARDTWVAKTGMPWSEAKRLGYTDGSAKDNMKLLSELNDPRFKKEYLRKRPLSPVKSKVAEDNKTYYGGTLKEVVIEAPRKKAGASRFMFTSDKAYQDYLKANKMKAPDTNTGMLVPMPAFDFSPKQKEQPMFRQAYQDGGEYGEGDMVRYGGGNTGIEKKDLKSLAKKYNKTPEQFLEIISEGEVRPDGGTMLRIGGANTGVPANWREEYKKSKPSTTGFRGALNKGLDYIGVDPIFNMGGYYQDGGEQQVAQQVAQAMQQGMQPQEAMSMLMESGMTEDQALQMVQAIMEQLQQQTETPQLRKGGEMIKRADGSYSRRGLWDNIRDNRGSGKKPTKEMLEQEAKIKREYQEGGMEPGADPTEMIMQQVAQMLDQGADPQQIMEQLIQMGIPQEVAQQMIEEILQEIEGGETEMEEPEEGTPQMSKGGKYMRALVGKTIKNYTYNPKTDSYIVSYE